MSARAAAALGALLAVACLLAAGCQSVPRDAVVETPGEEEMARLDVYGVRLAELSVRPDAGSLAALSADLDKAAASPGLSRRLLARVDGLRAEAALLAGDAAPGPRARRARRVSHGQRGRHLARARGARDGRHPAPRAARAGDRKG